MRIKPQDFLDLDFLAAAAAAGYAATVAAWEPAAYLGVLFASPAAAVTFATAAVVRWANRVREP